MENKNRLTTVKLKTERKTDEKFTTTHFLNSSVASSDLAGLYSNVKTWPLGAIALANESVIHPDPVPAD